MVKSGEDLILQDDRTTEVWSVQLTSKTKPISSFIKPFLDKFRGVIELETY